MSFVAFLGGMDGGELRGCECEGRWCEGRWCGGLGGESGVCAFPV